MITMYGYATLPGDLGTRGTGWLPQIPDLRDYTVETEDVKDVVQKMGFNAVPAKGLMGKVDLRDDCTKIKNQWDLGSCTAHAATGMMEYYVKRLSGKETEGARLFVYKTTRNLMGWIGDTGAFLRNTMGALVLCGVPPEKYWPYTVNKVSTDTNPETFDDEPTAFVYSLADNFESSIYFCHDPLESRRSPENILKSVKLFLAGRVPAMFGFYGFNSFNRCEHPGEIPYPCPGEQVQWGHAVMAVGYDDQKKIKNTRSCVETKGALLIRNSWGKQWGDEGYGWLPYDYVLNGLATDFWSLLSAEWVDTRKFGF